MELLGYIGNALVFSIAGYVMGLRRGRQDALDDLMESGDIEPFIDEDGDKAYRRSTEGESGVENKL